MAQKGAVVDVILGNVAVQLLDVLPKVGLHDAVDGLAEVRVVELSGEAMLLELIPEVAFVTAKGPKPRCGSPEDWQARERL